MRGRPPPAMRFFVAPVLVFSTLTLFGTGVALIAFGRGGPLPLSLLHKASFIVWVAVMTIHVLVYVIRAARRAVSDVGHDRIGGARLRQVLILGSLGAGLIAALLTLPIAEHWHHH